MPLHRLLDWRRFGGHGGLHPEWRSASRTVHRFTETANRSISCFGAIPDGKPPSTFPGIALSLVLTQFRTENRYALFLELLQLGVADFSARRKIRSSSPRNRERSWGAKLAL
ncbi:hypothetical protein FJ930_10915 [Mesorhizobium sp. B2-4-15]|nr:hypothetical protein FJ930_10915 [Mesorhizobium sp. B2-4-15]